ncbi:MAG: PHP domain-containing protein [Clostridia bacterium]|nr:PHP domain-containing protein [Clostridia bacterium]
MLPTPRSYMIWPSVVPADTKVTMTVTAAERAFLFIEGREYSLTVISVNSDENYYKVQNHKKLDAIGRSGALSFDFEFAGEGEHLIQLSSDEKLLASFTVYSLMPDLYALRPLKGDLHSHSCRSDGTRDPASQAGHYREQGYDFVALTDHNRYYPGGEIDEAYEGVNTGLVRIPGEEVHSTDSVVNIVHVGGRESVVDRYVHHREEYEKTISEYMEKVPVTVPEAYRGRYAKAMWATDAIHSVGGLAIFPHPFWRPGGSKTYNLPSELARIFLSSKMFDAYEILGAMSQEDLNRSVAMWSDMRAEGNKIPVVGSSDVHGLEKSNHFPYNSTICFAKEKNADSIIEAVKLGLSVAVEMNGYEYDVQYRCYGEYRLVSYAQFLLRNYFPMLRRLTAGAGVAMRAYVMEGIDASVINSYTEMANDYTERFFGRMAPKLPTDKILAFEDKWREIQLGGPKTRGSAVDSTPAPTLI